MPAGTRLWRTSDGDLVEDGHPDALSLAYGPGDDLDPKDLDQVRPAGEDKPETPAEPKAPDIEVPGDLTTVDDLHEWVLKPNSEDEVRERAKAVLALELAKDDDDRRVTLVDPLTELLTAEKVEPATSEPEKNEQGATPKNTGRPRKK